MRLLSIIVFTVVLISNTFGQTTPTTQVKLMSDLVALRIPTINNRLSALVTGRVTENDGGGGVFFYDGASAVATNLGTVFKPAATTGRWLRQYSGALNVRWFGAVGDGVADDYSSITNALGTSSGSSPVKGIYIPDGTYNTSGQILVTTEGMSIKGESPEKTVIQYTGGSVGGVVYIQGVTYNNFNVENLTINGNASSQFALHVKQANHSTFRNLRLRNVVASGLFADFCVTSLFENLSTSSNEDPWVVTPATGIMLTNLVTNCSFIMPIAEGLSGAGIYLNYYCNANVFEGGVSEGNGKGIQLIDNSQSNIFKGVYMEANTEDVNIDADSNFNYFIGTFGSAADSTIAGNRNVFTGGVWGGFVNTGNGNRFEYLNYASNAESFTDTGVSTEKIHLYKINTAAYDRSVQNLYQVDQITATTAATASTYGWLLNRGSTNVFGAGVDNNNAYLQTFNSYPLYLNGQGNNIILNATSGKVGIANTAPRALLDVVSGTANTPGDSPTTAIITASSQPVTIGTLSLQCNEPVAADNSAVLAFAIRHVTSDTQAANFGALRVGKKSSVSGNTDGYMAFHVRAQGEDLASASEKLRITEIGDLRLTKAGAGLQIKEGSNARMGTAILAAGTIAVANTSVTANTRVFISRSTDRGH
jgi:hypothetical protein